MYRSGHDPEDIKPADVLCDFCARPAWEMGIPCVEGHHGSIICGRCLEEAWRVLIVEKKGDDDLTNWTCTLCLEQRQKPFWQSPIRDSARVCRRCTKQAAGVLHKNPDWDWRKPDA